MRGLNVLVVSHVPPAPARAGNEIRIQRLLRWFRRRFGAKITFILRLLEERSSAELEAARGEVDRLVLCPPRVGRRPAFFPMYRGQVRWRVEEFTSGLTWSDAVRVRRVQERFFDDDVGRAVAHAISSVPVDVLISEYVFASRCLRVGPNVPVRLIDAHDAFHKKGDKVELYGFRDAAALSATQEAFLMSRSDVVVAIHEEERRAFEAILPAHVRVLTVGFETSVAGSGFGGVSEDGKVAVICGSGNPLNVRCVSEFLEQAWPEVLRRLPDARLHIVGRLCDRISDDVPGVVKRGLVDALAPEYERAQVALNPVYAGTGLKIKTVEALSFGLPVVLWENGADGVPVTEAPPFVVAGSWAEFARLTAELLSERERRIAMGAAARDLVATAYSGERVYKELESYIEERIR